MYILRIQFGNVCRDVLCFWDADPDPNLQIFLESGPRPDPN
jgi:hypothetical protein